MDSEYILNNQSSQDGQQRERPWTTDEIRKNSGNWTLAGDVGLFHLLNDFSHNIISRTHEMENAVDSLVHKTKIASVKINNVMNDFHMLSNLQFVENRVYDEEVQDNVTEEKHAQEKSKEQREAEMLPRVIQAIELGLSVLDQAFDKINVEEISDSEDEEDLSSEGRTILEPKDPYEYRPLPFIIGSEEFQNDDFAGLRELCEEEAVEISTEDQTVSESESSSSEEEELLPLDDTKFIGRQNEKVPPETISDRLSSSDESELFGSEKEENGFISDSSFDTKKNQVNQILKPNLVNNEEKDLRKDSVSSIQSRLNLPQVLPSPKKEEKPTDDVDLFANEDDISDDDSPFRKKTGLFATEVNFAKEDQDILGDDLFGEKPKKKAETPQFEKPIIQKEQKPPSAVKSSNNSVLFGDDDSEDDMFSTLTKTKLPQVTKSVKKENQEISKKIENHSASSLAVKKSEKTFPFKEESSNSLFGDDSDADDLFSGTRNLKKFDFEATEDDDLFGLMSDKTTKTSEEKKVASKSTKDEKTFSLFDESDSFDQSDKVEVTKSPKTAIPTKMQPSLFDDSDSSEPETKNEVKHSAPAVIEKKSENLSLFDKEDSFKQETKSEVKHSVPSVVEKKNENLSLFDKKDSFKQETTSSKTAKPILIQKEDDDLSLFDESVASKSKQVTAQPSNLKKKDEGFSLFDDSFESEKSIENAPVKETSNKPISLFEESDNFDLFTQKSTTKKETSPIKTSTVKKEKAADTIKVPASNNLVGSVSTKTEKPAKLETVGDIGPEIGFDVPISSSSTLNVLNKDRVKVAAKRRKPTRKGRLAALQSADSDETHSGAVESSSVASNSEPFSEENSSAADSVSFSLEKPKVTHKEKEKQKKDLMSQLISEVATSKIIKKNIVPKEDSDDEVDLFSTKPRAKSSSKTEFSFLSPTENSFESSKLPSAAEESKDKSEVSSIISSESADNDDFFTEPSFQGFRTSISHKNSITAIDDDDDDDLFKSIKDSPLPKLKAVNAAGDSNDIFNDEADDIFAGLQKEKYEMFPSQLYDDDDEDDIFGSSEKPTVNKVNNEASSKINSSTSKKEPEKKTVNLFDDPLTGMLED